MYWGRIIGTVAGAFARSPWIMLFGFFAGYQVDNFLSGYFKFNDGMSESSQRLPATFVRTLFQLMGYLAKCDGRVSEAEIRAARAMMHRLGLGPLQVRQSIAWFAEGKSPGFSVNDALGQLRADGARRAEQRGLFLRLLLEVSLSKGKIEKVERDQLWRISHDLGIGRVEFAQLEAMLRAQRGFRDSPQGGDDRRKVRAAYSTLGVQEQATNAEIKKAYRRLMNRNHPDKLVGRSADAATVAVAEQRTREVRRAYDLLKARRSIR